MFLCNDIKLLRILRLHCPLYLFGLHIILCNLWVHMLHYLVKNFDLWNHMWKLKFILCFLKTFSQSTVIFYHGFVLYETFTEHLKGIRLHIRQWGCKNLTRHIHCLLEIRILWEKTGGKISNYRTTWRQL